MYKEHEGKLKKVIGEIQKASYREGVGNLRKAAVAELGRLLHEKGGVKNAYDVLRDLRRFIINWC